MGVYLITGCSRGIGLALSKRLLDRGERVIGSVRHPAPPIEHANFRTVTFDVRDAGAVEAAAGSIEEPIDVLVNNAGIAGPKSRTAHETDPAAFAEVLDVNVLGPLRVIQAFLPHLRRAKAAKVMTISSQLGGMNVAMMDRPAYCTSKAAVNKLMQGVAADLAAEGIGVVIAHPGWVRTDMGGNSAPLDPDESARGLVGLIDRLTVEDTGRFMDWDGSERAW